MPAPSRLVLGVTRLGRLARPVRLVPQAAHEPTSTLAAEASARAALTGAIRFEEGIEVLRTAVRVTIDPRLPEVLLTAAAHGCLTPRMTTPAGA